VSSLSVFDVVAALIATAAATVAAAAATCDKSFYSVLNSNLLLIKPTASAVAAATCLCHTWPAKWIHAVNNIELSRE